MIMNRFQISDKQKKISTGILPIGQIFLNLVLACGCLVSLLPFLWIISTSLNHPVEALRMPPNFLPTSFVYQNYLAVFKEFPFFRFILNSFIVAIGVALLSLAITTLASFSFARINFKFKNTIFVIFLAGLMVPLFTTIISNYMILARAGLINTLWALILPSIINPLHIFLTRQFMMTIPKSYEEAAEINGCSRFKIFLFIILPMTKPVLILIILQSFIGSWNNFIAPLIFIHNNNKMTLPIGIRALQGFMGMGNISFILAGVTVSLIVPVLLYFFGQRYFIEGITLTKIKSLKTSE